MQKTLAGSVTVGSLALEYYLITEPRDDAWADYGVELCGSGGECVCIRRITVSLENIRSLLSLLIRNAVTPVTLRDVVDDWLP